jgi:hypothetical protein
VEGLSFVAPRQNASLNGFICGRCVIPEHVCGKW